MRVTLLKHEPLPNPCPDRAGQARPSGGQLGELGGCRGRGVNLLGIGVFLGEIRIWQRIESSSVSIGASLSDLIISVIRWPLYMLPDLLKCRRGCLGVFPCLKLCR